MKRWGSCSRTTLLATAWLHASSQLSHSLCRQAAILSQFFFCVQEIFLRTFTLMHIGKSRFHRNLSCLHPHSFALSLRWCCHWKDYVLRPSVLGIPFVTPIPEGLLSRVSKIPVFSQSKKVQGMETYQGVEAKMQLNLQTAVPDSSATAQV